MKRFGFILFIFSLSCFAQSIQGYENFHEIDPGRYYRSAQLFPADLETYIHQYGIRTVINLRGENPDHDWWQWESEVVTKLNVQHVNIAMSASIIPHKRNLVALLEAFRTAPRPILVHCKAGADRTGEASALYQMLYMNKTKKQAMKMLSPYYGHIKRFKPAKDYFIEKLWQGAEWAYNEYDPCSGQYRYYDVKNRECKN